MPQKHTKSEIPSVCIYTHATLPLKYIHKCYIFIRIIVKLALIMQVLIIMIHTCTYSLRILTESFKVYITSKRNIVYVYIILAYIHK